MEKENNKVTTIILRVLKIALFVLGFAALVGLVTHFICGIRDSLFAEDEITAQDRVASSYQFIRMALCGLIALAFFIPTIFIKVPLLPEKATNCLNGLMAKIFKKKKNEEVEKPIEEVKEQ